MRSDRRRTIRRVLKTYCALWLLTATWGMWDIDKDFDRKYAFGVGGLGDDGQVPIVRIDDIDIRDPWSGDAPEIVEPWWRWRSRGVPVAPFIVVDEAAVLWGSLAGNGGRRVVFWFFGWSVPKWLSIYWMV